MEITERDALTVTALRKTFEAENAPVRALRGIDLTVRAGEFVAVMGPSGCGKSTLLNLVAGLDVPDEGTITVAGETVTGRTEDDLARMRRKHMGIVFQFFNLLEGMTVLENVVLPSVIAGRRRKMAETRARDLLDLLGIGDKAAAVPGVLSGGQRQRLAIARALANEPTLLLADEPTGALDSAGGAEIIELLRRLHQAGQTIILVTHDQAVADAASRIVTMRDGRIVTSDVTPGSPDGRHCACAMNEQAGTGAVDRVLGAYRGEAPDGPATAARPAQAALAASPGPGHGRTRLLLAGLLLPLAATAVAVAGLAVPVPGGITGTAWVTATLIVIWSLCCVAAALAPERAPLWPQAAGAALGAVAFATDRLSARFAAEVAHRTGRPGQLSPATAHHLALAVGMIAAALMVAVSVHLMLSLPDGRLRARARRACAVAAYAIALAAGGSLAAAGQEVPAWLAVAIWSVALAVVFPAARLRYEGATARDRERMRWAAIGGAAGCGLALAVTVLSLLIGWPAPTGPVAEGFMVCFPLGLAAGNVPRLGGYGGRLLVQVLAVAGFAATVSVIYLVVILGLGRPPSNPADQRLLGLSMIAAAVAAISFAPARERLIDWANRQVFGARQAPDEVLRTFGSRMTRAIAMDELLLQLAESLRKTMTLMSAEVYTGLGDVLERTAAVPDTGARSLLIGERERPVIARAGVSGHAWASVWLPALVNDGAAGDQAALLRVAPVSHAGELLGLIVARRPAGADQFSAEDDRVLTELARQVGLALHNARLDTALATTLDELRKQAEELRKSRARIVASADAERRRVERDLHDGAQQHLVALAVNLRLTRELVTEDAETAVAMIDQLADEVKATIQELRDLAHGIYPPLLADSGLAEALRAAGRRSPLPVSVTAPGIGRYGLDVESAVYFCCLEALQNAAKHAAGASVAVRLWEESGGLLFSVTDDGPGFDPALARSGHGYTNMADRLGAIGGTARWDSVPGQGTTITGSVPLL